jgi:NTE family protein
MCEGRVEPSMRALSLPGCGCRGAFQIAVLRRLARRGERFAIVAGASSGSISGSTWVSGRAEVGPELFRAMASTKVVSTAWLRRERSPFGMSAIVRDALERFLPERDIVDGTTELLVSTTRARLLAKAAWAQLRKGRGARGGHTGHPAREHRRGATLEDARVVHSSRERRDLHDVVVASCTIPGIYARLPRIDGEVHVDGGASDNTLLGPLVSRGATEITLITPYAGGVVARTLFEAERRPDVPAGVRLRVISPARPLSLGRFDFDRARLEEALGMPQVEVWFGERGETLETRRDEG